MGFSRQEYWSELPFPPPGDLSCPGTEPRSPALQADSLLPEPPGKPLYSLWVYLNVLLICVSSLIVCAFLGMCPFYLCCYLLTYNCSEYCYNAFYFCESNSNIPSFIPDFNNLILLSFFLEINVAKDISILLTFSENKLLVFFIFSVVFLPSVPFIFALLIIFFLFWWLWVYFVLFYLVCFYFFKVIG